MVRLVLLFFCFSLSFNSIAQVGIGTLNPNSRSVLELKSLPGAGKGLLIPRVSSDERRGMELGSDSIGTPLTNGENGLLLYDQSQNLFYGYQPQFPTVSGPYPITGLPTLDEDRQRKWQILNPWRSQYAWDGSKLLLNLLQDTVAAGYVGIGWTDLSIAPLAQLHVIGDGLYENGNLKVDQKITSRSVVADTVGVDTTLLQGYGSVPVGTILTWSGVWDINVENVMLTKGWVLCDGRSLTYRDILGNDRTIPDLRGRFIVGFDGRDLAGGGDPDYREIGDMGPYYSQTLGVNDTTFYVIVDDGKRVALKEPAMPKHTHNIHPAGSHKHDFYTGQRGINGSASNAWKNGFNKNRKDNMAEAGEHVHTIDEMGGYVFPDFTDMDAVPIENRPPYYTLAYIIRIK